MDLAKIVVIVVLVVAVLALVAVLVAQVINPAAQLASPARQALATDYNDGTGDSLEMSNPRQIVSALFNSLGVAQAWSVAISIMGAGMVLVILSFGVVWLIRTVAS